ncbi:hypothetical protein Tco_1541497 [Tanacetum coccineum]
MTSGKEMTPPLGFSTPPHIPNINTTKRPPVTTTVFSTTTPGNTPFAYRASTLTDLAPMIRFKEASNRERSIIGKNIEGNGPSKAGAEENGRREMNLPLLLVAYLGRNKDGQPLRSSLTFVHGGRQSSINTGGNLPPNAQAGNPSVGGASAYPPQGGQQKRFTKMHLAVHSIKHREGESVRAFATRLRKSSWDNGRGQRSRDRKGSQKSNLLVCWETDDREACPSSAIFMKTMGTGNGYSLKDKNKAKPDKTEHGITKSAKNQSRRHKHLIRPSRTPLNGPDQPIMLI